MTVDTEEGIEPCGEIAIAGWWWPLDSWEPREGGLHVCEKRFYVCEKHDRELQEIYEHEED